MPRLRMLALLLLSACGPVPRAITVEAPAPENALSCFESVVQELKYTLVAPSRPQAKLRAERQLAWSQHTPYVRWHRIDAAVEKNGPATLRLEAGVFERRAGRELVGHLVAPDNALESDLRRPSLNR